MFTTLDVALSQLGVFEATNRNDGIPAERYMRGDELAWCAGFQLYCNAVSDDESVASSTKEHYLMRRVEDFMKVCKRKGIFLAPFNADGTPFIPQPNDWVFFGNTASDVGVTGEHMGITEVVDPETGKFTAIEGNYANKVARVKHVAGEKEIIGYARISLLEKERSA